MAQLAERQETVINGVGKWPHIANPMGAAERAWTAWPPAKAVINGVGKWPHIANPMGAADAG